LHDSGGAAVAAEVGAVSADHLENTPPEIDEKLREAGVVPVMLPGADFFLASTKYAPARRFIAAGLPVAVATDFNPGTCMCENMQMMLTLAGLQLKMTPEEAMIAATLHAARAVAAGDKLGSLEKGKQADFVIWNATSVAEIPYHFGTNRVEQVYKKGKRVFTTSHEFE
ncbi:MAG: imidazolonepropionase, partial [Calditrichaeota bacterium]